MKIRNIEVKTTYSVAINAKDMAAILEDYNNGEGYAAAGTFKEFETVDLTRGQMLDILKKIGFCGNCATYNYIAQRLGFDGWENAGYYDEKTRSYIMRLYRHGDALN